MTTKEVLEQARDLLICKGWTQGVGARDEAGALSSPLGPDACSFCVLGAIDRVCVDNVNQYTRVRNALCRALEHENVISFNDATGRTLDEVVALLDKAIAGEG